MYAHRQVNIVLICTYYNVYSLWYCSESAFPNNLAVWLATCLEWSTVTQEFWARILADPKYIPLWNYFIGGSGNSVTAESASGSGSGLYAVVCL